MRYYITRPSLNWPKNKAQEHIQTYIKRFFNMLVSSDEDLNLLVEKIKKEVEKTNSLFPRCRNMEVHVDRYEQSDSINIWIQVAAEPSFAHLSAKKVYTEYKMGFIENYIL